MNRNRLILFSAIAVAGMLAGCVADEITAPAIAFCNTDGDCNGYICLQDEDAHYDAEFIGECSEHSADGCAEGYVAEDANCVPYDA